MSRIGLAIRLMFLLPPVWIVLAALALVIVTNGWEPGVDIARYAVERLSP